MLNYWCNNYLCILLLIAEHKARINFLSKTMIFSVFPLAHSVFLQMVWNLDQCISIGALQCIRWSAYLSFASTGLVSEIMWFSIVIPPYEGEQHGMVYIYVSIIFDILFSALGGSIRNIRPLGCTDYMSFLINCCEVPFMSYSNRKSPQK